jgi:hypothetical protein
MLASQHDVISQKTRISSDLERPRLVQTKCWQSGLNDLITALYIAVAAWEPGYVPPCTLRSVEVGDVDGAACSSELPFTACVVRKRGNGRVGCCPQCFDTWQNWWQFWLTNLCIPVKFTVQVSTVGSEISTILLAARCLYSPPVAPALSWSDPSQLVSKQKTEEKQRFFLSILGCLPRVVNICASATIFFDFMTKFEVLLHSSLLFLENVKFLLSKPVLSSFCSHLLHYFSETVKDYPI